MKKSAYLLSTILIFLIGFVGPVLSENMGDEGHDHGKMTASKSLEGHKNHQMEHSGRMGKMIHEAEVDGYKLMYHLIDIGEHMQNMHKTHHLMAFISSHDNHTIDKAKVGYLLTGPDSAKQKTMTMSMSGGFGADVNMPQKGTYTITTKVMVDGKKLIDKFEYKAE